MPTLSKLYDDVVMDHIKNARNFRALPDAERSAAGLNVLCGDSMTVYVKLDGEAIGAAGFQCECCGISMASASIMTEAVAGRPLEQVKALHEAVVTALDDGEDRLGDWEGARAIVEAVRAYPSRRRCALLPWATLAAALAGETETQI
jgi:nitrogen fixation protein NifU and related proteins